MNLSTTDTLYTNGRIISVVNRIIYGGSVLQRQAPETLELLRQEAKKQGAQSVVGVCLVPILDTERNVSILMAYGTIVTE